MNNDFVFSNATLGGLFGILIVCLMLPVFYLIFYTMKKKINLLTVLMGVGGFLILGYFLSGLLIGSLAPSSSAEQAPIRYAVIRGLCTGICEGGGAVAAMWLIRRWFDDISTPISYSLGYPLVHMLLVGGGNAFIRMANAYTVNEKGLNALLETVEGEAQEVLIQELQKLADTPVYEFVFSAVDYICFFAMMAAVVRIAWYCVHPVGAERKALAAVCIALVAAADLPTALYQAGAVENYIVCQSVRYFITLLGVGAAVLLSLRYDTPEKVSAGPLNRKLL